MDEDVPRAPRAGRRAVRTENTWDDDSAMPPEPQKGGFGLDSGFSGPSPTPSLPKPTTTDTDESPAQPRARNNNDDSSSRGQPADAGSSRSATQRPTLTSRPSAADMLGEDSKKFVGISRRKQEQLARGDDETSRKNLRYDALTAGVDGIMEIPELEDEGREDLSNVVAEAPKVRTNKVQGMDELDENVHYKLPAMDDRDIDLSLLTAVLCSSEQVQETDNPWDPDIIITEVASAINAEREKAEGGDGSGAPLEEGGPGREEILSR